MPDFVIVDAAYNSYHRLWQEKLILAVRAFANVASKDTPFYLLPAIGQGPDLRGYAYGRYRDRLLLTAQAELRYNFWWRFGAVAFGGAGTTTSSLSKVFDGPALPSYGAGVRFFLHPKERLVMRTDYARGKHSGQFYFSVSEAF